MKKFTIQSLLSQISVSLPLYHLSEARDQKLIVAMSFMIYVSCMLGGYSIYVSAYFLLQNFFVASILGVASTIFLILHDQTLLGTGKTAQIYSKIFVSLVLAATFTLTNSASKEYDTLSAKIVADNADYNADIRLEMNFELEKIESEERNILQRIEQAGIQASHNIQPLIDARRTLVSYKNSKSQRITRIKEAYASKFQEPQISDLTILSMQARQLLNGEEGALISLVLLFIFFILESLPALVRIMLGNGDYMTRFLAVLDVNRELRDQKIELQKAFTSPSGNIIKSILMIELIKEKREMILTDFASPEKMIILDQRMRILNAGINPYTGKRLDHVDLNFSQNYDEASSDKKATESAKEEKKSTRQEEPVFNL